ncbi:MAG: hypothetical protein AAGI25_19695 [Bacteroidota bacterium]
MKAVRFSTLKGLCYGGMLWCGGKSDPYIALMIGNVILIVVGSLTFVRDDPAFLMLDELELPLSGPLGLINELPHIVSGPGQHSIFVNFLLQLSSITIIPKLKVVIRILDDPGRLVQIDCTRFPNQLLACSEWPLFFCSMVILIQILCYIRHSAQPSDC